VRQDVGHVARARELVDQVRGVAIVGRQAVVDVQYGHGRVGLHLDEVVEGLEVGQRRVLADAAQGGRLRLAVHRLLFDDRVVRRRRRLFRLDQQVVVLHQTPGQQFGAGHRGRRTLQLLVHLVVGHERRGRARAEQHVVSVFVVVQHLGGHAGASGRQQRDRGRRVQRVDHLDLERLRHVEHGRRGGRARRRRGQRRLVVERCALRRVGRFACRAGRHLSVDGRGHAHLGATAAAAGDGGGGGATAALGLGRVDGEMILEPVRVHRAHPVHLDDAVAADDLGRGQFRQRLEVLLRGHRLRRNRARPLRHVVNQAHGRAGEASRQTAHSPAGRHELLGQVFPVFLVRGHRGLRGGRGTVDPAVLRRPVAGSVLVVRILFEVHQSEAFRLVQERFLVVLGQQFPQGAELLRYFRVVHVRLQFAYLAAFDLRPHHERVHWPLDVIRIVLLGLEYKKTKQKHTMSKEQFTRSRWLVKIT